MCFRSLSAIRKQPKAGERHFGAGMPLAGSREKDEFEWMLFEWMQQLSSRKFLLKNFCL